MNKRGYLAILVILSAIPPFRLSPASTTPSITVPWSGTFSGINAPATPAPTLTSSGPFEAATLPAALAPQATTDPFGTSANNISAQTTQATAQSITQLLTSIYTPLPQQINAMFTSNTTVGGSPLKVTPSTKYRVPPAASSIANLGNVSFTQGQNSIQQPPQALFPSNQALTQAYANFMSALQATPGFFPLFRKLHITALQEIYTYLLGIYTSLNMTHIDDLKTYMVTEKTYALNKKTLIINHLVNVVMAQLNQSIRALMPGMPESQAISSGMRCIQSDNISNPNMLILDLEKSVLAILGLQQLDPLQTSLVYHAIRQYMPILEIQATEDLTNALALLNSTNFSIKALSKNQAVALTTVIYQILTYLSQQARFGNLDALVEYLQDPATANPTSQQVAQLATLVGKFSYAEILENEISLCQKLAQLLGNGTGTPSDAPLSTNDLKGLKGILAYLLQQYEQFSVQDLSQVIEVLGQLNPTYQVLSPSQALALKAIAASMIAPTQPLALENLTDDQRTSLSYGLWVASNNTTNSPFTTAQQKTLESIAVSLKQHPLTLASLSEVQQTALQQALTFFSSYTLAPLSRASFGQVAEKNVTGIDSAATDQEKQNDLMQALKTLRSPSFRSFNQLTQEEQILLLQLFQLMDQVFETRLETHKAESSSIQYLLAQDTATQKALFTSMTSSQYETLTALDALLETTGSVSCKDLCAVTAPAGSTAWMDPQKALLKLVTVPQSVSIKTPPSTTTSQTAQVNGTSYLNVLLLLKQQQFQNEAITSFTKTISPADAATYQTILPLISSQGFTFNQIDPAIRSALASTIKAYKTVLAAQPAKTATNAADSSDATQSALETVGAAISYNQKFSNMRSSFLGVLQEYLTFFNLYAQTLQNVSNDPANPPYVGLTTFADYAQNIKQQLNYESSSNDSIAQLLEQANPPLFFYDPDTFRGIRLLPKLAALVENSSIAPYPTFGIEQAVSGSALDPTNSTVVNNMANIGSFSYQKFFFLQAPDSTTELTGILPAFIKKTAVVSSQGTSYLYEPNNLPDDGITGFYMNIPTFAPDPASKNSMIIRLYEQPIIAQPAWLNKSGAAPGTPQAGAIPADSAGVITVLRGCLGDFQAILNLGIFDPCLTVIFNSALALSANGSPGPGATALLQDTGGKCSAYIKQKQAMVQEQQNPVATESANSSAQPEGATIAKEGAQ